jgi:uncharacterized iron-regulated membrane protein
MLCLTGLPLIFHHEIDDALGHDHWRPANPDGPHLGYDRVLEIALGARPGEVPIFMSFDEDRPVVNVTTGLRPNSPESEMHFASYDLTSGALVPQTPDGGVMDFILQLHTDMFLGLPGMLFLGVMGLCLAASVVSGLVVYAPFMRKLPFGAVRASRSARARWLDLHNLMGVVTIAWVLTVGLTGVVNTLAVPIIDYWKSTELAALTRDNAGAGVVAPVASIDAAVAVSKEALPGMTLQFVAFPGGSFSTGQHYAVFFHGDQPLTRHLITPALIDARTGAFTAVSPMPWYAKTLSLSQPLHFGDYGGLPLKILWAVLDIVTIVITASGLWLWFARRRAGGKSSPAVRAAAP